MPIRPLQKLATSSKVQGDGERKTAVYTQVHEDLSTASTKEFTDVVEFPKRSTLIFAAGRGQRMRPFTDSTPKCLYPIHGKPMIVHLLEHIHSQGLKHVYINTAYLGGQIRRYLGNGAAWNIDITYFLEPPGGLETGGTLAQIRRFAPDDVWLTINADIYTDCPIRPIVPEYLAHIVVIPTAISHGIANFGLDNGVLTNSNPKYTASGITYYHPDALKSLPIGRYSITPYWRKWVQNKQCTAEVYEGIWESIDIVSPVVIRKKT